MIEQLAVAGGIGLAAGLSIGCIGVGGLIIVPMLVQLGGVPIHAAIAAAMAGYIVTGLIGSSVFLHRGTLRARSALPTVLGAMPGALLGAFAAGATPAAALQFLIAALAASSGLQILRRDHPAVEGRPAQTLTAPTGLFVGVLTGFLSALTGTGGPAVLLPVLLWLKVPILSALGLAQAIQPPIALLATLGNLLTGTMDWVLSVPLALGLAIGAWIGARLAHALNHARLRKLVGAVLLGAGLLLFGRVVARLI